MMSLPAGGTLLLFALAVTALTGLADAAGDDAPEQTRKTMVLVT
jgi:hypothetical protein